MRPGRHSFSGVPPHFMVGTMDSAMIEFLFIYQLARNPVQAVARRWWCRSLFRVTRGKRRCQGCTNS
jgi:hypothetical protein